MYLVLAGDRNQAREWAEARRLTSWQYVSRPEDFIGFVSSLPAIAIGTWYENDDVCRAYDEMKSRGFKIRSDANDT